MAAVVVAALSGEGGGRMGVGSFEGGLIVWYHDVFNLQAAIWSWLFMVVG